MYDLSAVLPEQLVELLVTRTEHQGPHSSYIPHTNDIILGCIYVYATEKRELNPPLSPVLQHILSLKSVFLF